MDLQGIGAITAALVAAIAVPAALLAGRWQMRAALRTAEETGRAGIAQAEATYRAALDTVRAEASVAHLQWRRGVRREAYTSFLLASQRVTEAAQRLRDDCFRLPTADMDALRDELLSAATALREASLIVSLEGPEDISDIANRVREDTYNVMDALTHEADLHEAWGALEHACQDEEQSARAAVRGLRDALIQLRARVREDPFRGDHRARVGSMPTLIAEAHNAVRQAFAAVPPGTLPLSARTLEDLQFNGLSRVLSAYSDGSRDLTAARDEFISSARIELDDVRRCT
ncbi:hypothetical protein HRW23_32585 [Streptomyces lunaelactis]|nr:hypothetical protein [Streptomyces lunaelactis]NUK05439.1 hypothetical protein [Streptomyces lunaelactis]NUK19785.1 hypothetical protein [Streptomyces lunaelactis]NUK25142.1 hypothetical protein [Streptomyces lunaelactis]NUK52873.1 hypothetical protein [Streptomyces lunaelactis]NUK67477.1 hypothetical protein [Streptomyces lunaelactis]